jgi:hypothetical protein
MLPEDSVLNTKTCRSDIHNIREQLRAFCWSNKLPIILLN